MVRVSPLVCKIAFGLVASAAPAGCTGTPATGDPPAADRAEAAPAAPSAPPVTSPAPTPIADSKPAPNGPTPGTKGEAYLDAASKHDEKTLDEWIVLLADKDDLARSAAADAVAKYGPNAKAAVPALAKILADPKSGAWFNAVDAVKVIGPAAGDAVDTLIGLLRDRDPGVRLTVAYALADLGPAAGKAVPALIGRLDDRATTAGGGTVRDAALNSIEQLGRYDIRAVFTAVRQDKLSDANLGFVIDSLGPDDAQAVEGLVQELKPTGDLWEIYALGGLKRIGPNAASALPAVRALLEHKSPEVRKSAAEAVTAIGAGNAKDPPKGEAPKKNTPPEDIQKVMTAAGFDEKIDWGRHLSAYVRFGSKAAADKYFRGDQFDKIEAEKAARGHRDALRDMRFRVTGLKFRPVVRSDIETRGLVAELELPMRVRGGEPFHADSAAFSGILAGSHPSELDSRRNSFLTKDGTLRPCTPAEAREVERNDGVVYHPEVATTTLILVFKDKLDVLRGLVREARGYSVELDFTDLHYRRPLAWGYFRRDAYQAADWDCQKLWVDYLLDKDNPQPVYFPTALADAKPVGVPEIVWARLDSLRVLDKDGKVVGGYRVK